MVHQNGKATEDVRVTAPMERWLESRTNRPIPPQALASRAKRPVMK